MKRLVGIVVLALLWCCSKSEVKTYPCSHPDKFMSQIDQYIDECSMHYYKIRACAPVHLYSAYDTRAWNLWDSLRIIYPDSMGGLVKVEGEPKKPAFKIGEQQFGKIPEDLRYQVGQYEIEVEYEVDLRCCDEKICCSYFRFNSDSILLSVRESAGYMTIPGRYQRDFVYEKK